MKGNPRARFSTPAGRHSISFRTLVGSMFRPPARRQARGLAGHLGLHNFNPNTFGPPRGRRWFQ